MAYRPSHLKPFTEPRNLSVIAAEGTVSINWNRPASHTAEEPVVLYFIHITWEHGPATSYAKPANQVALNLDGTYQFLLTDDRQPVDITITPFTATNHGPTASYTITQLQPVEVLAVQTVEI